MCSWVLVGVGASFLWRLPATCLVPVVLPYCDGAWCPGLCASGARESDAGGGLDGDARFDGDRVASDFVCDDGQPCGDVCRCRLLFWCRFRTRKVRLQNLGSKLRRILLEDGCLLSLCFRPAPFPHLPICRVFLFFPSFWAMAGNALGAQRIEVQKLMSTCPA
jgi:hypothetical protein